VIYVFDIPDSLSLFQKGFLFTPFDRSRFFLKKKFHMLKIRRIFGITKLFLLEPSVLPVGFRCFIRKFAEICTRENRI